MTTTQVESKIRAMEAEIADLRERLERNEFESDMRIAEAQFARGEAVPAREALEKLRQKLKIPAK